MITLPNSGKLTVTHLLVPISVTAFVLFIMLAFQTTQVLRDRQNLNLAASQQQKPFEQALSIQNQVNVLAIGTQRLADKGDKAAQAIIGRMNKLGIMVNAGPGGGAPPQGGPPSGMMPAKGMPMPTSPRAMPPPPSR